MKFCSVCRNMYYITMGDAPGSSPEEATTKVLIHKCRNCGNEEKNTEASISVSKTFFKQSDVHLADVVNEYTHLDPTLPRIKSMKCPNVECETNTELDKPCTVLYIRYDDTNLKFVYMCSSCKHTWNTEQFSAASSS
jgi:DNA-directed RNA polymerase subunit M/transcription elongation factor TFIIS